MPLPSDPKLLALSQNLLNQLDAMFGLHPGFRPAHAKGILLTGSFTPSPQAASLTRAPHMLAPSTPITARFSDSTANPLIPDNDPNADPRGFAIRFNLAPHVHTDIITHSVDAFPARTGQEFLEFLQAAAASDPNKPRDPAHPSPIEKFLATHPAALAFIQTPKPAPSSFACQPYFGVTAFRFTNQQNTTRFGRYRLAPCAGEDRLTPAALAAKSPTYLFDELQSRLANSGGSGGSGGSPVVFKLHAQLANPGDVTDDATIHWPPDRPILDLGTITLTAPVPAPDNAAQQKQIIFDPIPRVDGIDPSGDPLLEVRAAVYLLSGRRRRAAAV